MKRFFCAPILILLSILLADCSAGNVSTSSNTSIPTNPPASFSTQAQLPVIPPTMTVTSTPTVSPIPIGGGNGMILVSQVVQGELIDSLDESRGYYPSSNLLLMDINEPPGRVLISKAQIEEILNKKFISVEFDPSPDKKNTVIYACTNIDLSHGFRPYYDVYIASLDLNSVVPIQMNMELMETHWNWSPDGTKLAGFIPVPGQFQYSLRVLHGDGSEFGSDLGNWVTYEGSSSRPFWLPDSSRLSFTQSDTLVELNLDGSGDYKLYDTDIFFDNLGYSPDGQKVAVFSSDPLNDQWEKLVVTNADFSNPLTIFERDWGLTSPFVTWSPDNQYIVIQDEFDVAEIFKADTGGIISINMPDEKIQQFCGWSPDNKFVYILIDDRGIPYLSLVDPLQLDAPESGFRVDFWGGLECPVWLP